MTHGTVYVLVCLIDGRVTDCDVYPTEDSGLRAALEMAEAEGFTRQESSHRGVRLWACGGDSVRLYRRVVKS